MIKLGEEKKLKIEQGLTVPARMSEEPISSSSIVHKHHNNQRDTKNKDKKKNKAK